ncbi:uncharacterized protein LOC144451039 [Glandiceps talaboti]
MADDKSREESLTILDSPTTETQAGDLINYNYESDSETSQDYNKYMFHSSKMDLSLKILKEELVGLRSSGDSLSRKVATMFRTFNEMKDSGALSDVSDVEFEYESDDDSQTTNPSSAGSLEDDEDDMIGDKNRELRRSSCPTNSLDSGYYSRSSELSYGRPMRPGSLMTSPPISGEEDFESSEDDNEISHHSRCSCCPPSPTESISSAESFCSSRSSSTSSLSDSDDEINNRYEDTYVTETQSSEVAETENDREDETTKGKTKNVVKGPKNTGKPWRTRRLSPVYEQPPDTYESEETPVIPTLVFERSKENNKDQGEEVIKTPLGTIDESMEETSLAMSPLPERRSPEGSADDVETSDTVDEESVHTEIEVDNVFSEDEVERKTVQQLKEAFQAKNDKPVVAKQKESSVKRAKKEKKRHTKEKDSNRQEREDAADKSASSDTLEENSDGEKVLTVSEGRKLFETKNNKASQDSTARKLAPKKQICPHHHRHHSHKEKHGKEQEKKEEKPTNRDAKNISDTRKPDLQQKSGQLESRYQAVQEPDKEELASQVRDLKKWWKEQQGGKNNEKHEKGHKIEKLKTSKSKGFQFISDESEHELAKSRLLDELTRSQNFSRSGDLFSENEDLVAVQPVYSRIQYGKPGSKPKTAIVIPSTSTRKDDEEVGKEPENFVLMKPVVSKNRYPREGQEEKTPDSPKHERSRSLDAGFKLMEPVRGITKPSRPTITSKIRQRVGREPCRVANIVSPEEPVHSQVFRRTNSSPGDPMGIVDRILHEQDRRWSLTPEDLARGRNVSPKRRHCVGSDPYATMPTIPLTNPSTKPEQQLSAAKIVLSAKPDKVRTLFKELQQMATPPAKTEEERRTLSVTPRKGTDVGNFVFVKENRVIQMPDGTTKDSKCLKIVVTSKKKPTDKVDTGKQEGTVTQSVVREGDVLGQNTQKRVTSTFRTEMNIESSQRETPATTRGMPFITREVPFVTTDIPMISRQMPMTTTDVQTISGDFPTFSIDIPMMTREMSPTSREIPMVMRRVPATPNVARQQSIETHTTSYQTRIGSPDGNIIVIRRQKHFEPRRVTANFQIEVPSQPGQRPTVHHLEFDPNSNRTITRQRDSGGRVKSTYRYTFGS